MAQEKPNPSSGRSKPSDILARRAESARQLLGGYMSSGPVEPPSDATAVSLDETPLDPATKSALLAGEKGMFSQRKEVVEALRELSKLTDKDDFSR